MIRLHSCELNRWKHFYLSSNARLFLFNQLVMRLLTSLSKFELEQDDGVGAEQSHQGEVCRVGQVEQVQGTKAGPLGPTVSRRILAFTHYSICFIVLHLSIRIWDFFSSSLVKQCPSAKVILLRSFLQEETFPWPNQPNKEVKNCHKHALLRSVRHRLSPQHHRDGLDHHDDGQEDKVETVHEQEDVEGAGSPGGQHGEAKEDAANLKFVIVCVLQCVRIME